MNMLYFTTAAQEKKVSTKVKSIIKSLKLSEKSKYQKIKAIYNYICTNIKYNNKADKEKKAGNCISYSAYGGLINKTCVCNGYAVIFYRLALEAGIDARCIYDNNVTHMWNIVKLGDYYYNVDTTWDSNWYEARKKMSYKYFLKGMDSFPDHTRNSKFKKTAFKKKYPTNSVDYKYAKALARLTKTTLSSVSNVKGRKMKIKWKRNKTGTGYQIQYAKNKSFTNAVKKVIPLNKATSITYSGLKKGKTYYVRIRTYVVISGKKYYSGWSTTKKVVIRR